MNPRKEITQQHTRLQGVGPGEAVPAAQLQHRVRRAQWQRRVVLAEEAHEVDARLPHLEPAWRGVGCGVRWSKNAGVARWATMSVKLRPSYLRRHPAAGPRPPARCP